MHEHIYTYLPTYLPRTCATVVRCLLFRNWLLPIHGARHGSASWARAAASSTQTAQTANSGERLLGLTAEGSTAPGAPPRIQSAVRAAAATRCTPSSSAAAAARSLHAYQRQQQSGCGRKEGCKAPHQGVPRSGPRLPAPLGRNSSPGRGRCDHRPIGSRVS